MGKIVATILIATLVFGGLAVMALASYGPDLITELRVNRKTLTLDRSLRIEKASCRSRSFVSMCTVKYSERGGIGNGTLSYMMIGGSRPKPVELMRPRGSRSIVVSNLGLDNWGNRLTTLLLFVGGLMGLVLAIAFKGVKAMAEESDEGLGRTSALRG